MAVEYSSEDVLEMLKAEVNKLGSQTAMAARIGCTPQFLHDVLKGRRNLSDSVAAGLGLKRLVVFRRGLLTDKSCSTSGRAARPANF